MNRLGQFRSSHQLSQVRWDEVRCQHFSNGLFKYFKKSIWKGISNSLPLPLDPQVAIRPVFISEIIKSFFTVRLEEEEAKMLAATINTPKNNIIWATVTVKGRARLLFSWSVQVTSSSLNPRIDVALSGWNTLKMGKRRKWGDGLEKD